MSISEIKAEILKLDLSQLEEIESTIKYKKESNFRIGKKVSFLSKRNNIRLYGKINKINTKTIQIDTDHDGRWNVSKSLLRVEV
tara:strand:+ start:1336 stop:1587 length:252 start_codon:yes stop_codon:yes gene_type:complete